MEARRPFSPAIFFSFFFFIYVGHRSCPVGTSSFLSTRDGPNIDSRRRTRTCLLSKQLSSTTNDHPPGSAFDQSRRNIDDPPLVSLFFLSFFLFPLFFPLLRQHDSFDVKMHVRRLLALIVARTFSLASKFSIETVRSALATCFFQVISYLLSRHLFPFRDACFRSAYSTQGNKSIS